MPRGDGSGPPRGQGQRGGRMLGNRPGIGPGGNCVCPNCGEKVPHQRGTPCYSMSCPKCGTKMVRE
jgi:predicted amidophosphoribosyltransferase